MPRCRKWFPIYARTLLFSCCRAQAQNVSILDLMGDASCSGWYTCAAIASHDSSSLPYPKNCSIAVRTHFCTGPQTFHFRTRKPYRSSDKHSVVSCLAVPILPLISAATCAIACGKVVQTHVRLRSLRQDFFNRDSLMPVDQLLHIAVVDKSIKPHPSPARELPRAISVREWTIHHKMRTTVDLVVFCTKKQLALHLQQ